ncbi:hypothetical protein [Cohnella terricola]|uniref:PAP2 superfamily protein n=1 Tax=Cohnella terricola TaxID=1289167 RepID=A0A559J625_9BACL|nr:hypothetical protein [Cohnella terricola]TVX95301.1 hypothetical protein FPZ45_23645 [Cohnella terricola]
MPNNEPGFRLAYAISFLFHPFVVVMPLFLIVSLQFASNAIEAIIWWLLIVAGVSAAPFAFIRRGVVKGKLADHDISKREQRLVPFLYTIGCMAISLALLLALRVPVELLATFTGMISAVALALLVTQLARWKISLHLIGISGAVLTLGLLVSAWYFSLTPLIALVGWARWRVKAHTPTQAAAGVFLASVVTIAVCILYGLGGS